MKTKICKKCGIEFPLWIKINGINKMLYKRVYCMDCSPYKNLEKQREKTINNKLTPIQEQILNGHLLGDGCLHIPSAQSKNARFQLIRAASDIEYLDWSAEYFKDYIPSGATSKYSSFDKRYNKTYYKSSFYTRTLPIFTEYYNKWYPEGKKIVPKDLVLTPLIIAVWLADDGCIGNYKNGQLVIQFSTNNFPYKDVEFLHSQLCILYGDNISINQHGYKKQYIISISNTITSKTLIRDIIFVFPTLPRKSDVWNREIVDLWDKNKITNPNCVWCGSSKNSKNGYYKYEQKYFCKNCRKTYYSN